MRPKVRAGRSPNQAPPPALVGRYKEGELNVGENSCVDRCASKYWQVRSGVDGDVG